MENLGLFIYLCSIVNGILVIAAIGAGASFMAILLCLIMAEDEYDAPSKHKYYKWCKKYAIVLVALCLMLLFIPSKQTCYQIFGVTKAVELYRSSESLQQLPEKSIEALNRILDSIAPEEEKED